MFESGYYIVERLENNDVSDMAPWLNSTLAWEYKSSEDLLKHLYYFYSPPTMPVSIVINGDEFSKNNTIEFWLSDHFGDIDHYDYGFARNEEDQFIMVAPNEAKTFLEKFNASVISSHYDAVEKHNAIFITRK